MQDQSEREEAEGPPGGAGARVAEALVRAAYRPPPSAARPAVSAPRSSPSRHVHVAAPGVVIGADEALAFAADARDAGHAELHLLAWSFAPGLRLQIEGRERELGLAVRLVVIPPEVLARSYPQGARTGGRRLPLFVELSGVAAEPLLHPDGSVDLRLTRFLPGLPLFPEPAPESLKVRAARSPFDFIDYWAVDFGYSPLENEPAFRHQWQSFRSAQNRRIALESGARHRYDTPGVHTAAVRVTDLFGRETLAPVTLEIR